MRPLSIDVVDEIYSCAAQYSLHRYKVRYPELGEFCIGLNHFVAKLGDQTDDPYWQKFTRYLRHFRFDLSAAPLSSGSRDEMILDVCNELQEHLRSCHSVYPNFAQPAMQLLSSIRKLHGDTKNPLVDKLVELSKVNRRVAWVMKESRLIPYISDVICSRPEVSNSVEAMHFTQLFTNECFDKIMVVGSPQWFPDSIFMSPRASVISIVQYSWMYDNWQPREIFAARYISSHPVPRMHIDDNISEPVEISSQSLLLVPNSHAISTYIKRHEHQEYEEIEARCVLFEGGQAMFVEASESAKIHCIDIDEESIQVKSILTRDLEAGLFVLVRTNGGGDYIVPIADEIMGPHARIARNKQSHWKSLLRRHVVTYGLLETCVRLLDLGSEIADEANVRNWIYPRNIKTRSKTDFRAIMRLVGLKSQADEYWDAMHMISAAHRSAGFRLRKMLLAQIHEISLEDFNRTGRVELKLSEGDDEAGITAFRVDEILPDSYTVSYTQVGMLFELGT